MGFDKKDKMDNSASKKITRPGSEREERSDDDRKDQKDSGAKKGANVSSQKKQH